MTGRIAKVLVLILFALGGSAGVTAALAQEETSNIDCTPYLWQEDAELGEEQHDICLDLPSISEAPTCADFSSQAEAQELFESNTYGYRMLTPYGSGTGEDSTTACPELAADTGGGADAPGEADAGITSQVVALPETGSGGTSDSDITGLMAIAGMGSLMLAALISRRFAGSAR